MKACLTMFSFFFCVVAFSQQPRKIKIDELSALIKKADHPFVVSFWATWCSPCVEEIPDLQAAVKTYAQKKVELVLVSLDFKSYYPAKLTDFIKQKKFEGSFYWLDETNADLFCPKINENWTGAIPATLFVNNKSGYSKFYEQQLKKEAIGAEMKSLVE